jgi:hypothetical protein
METIFATLMAAAPEAAAATAAEVAAAEAATAAAAEAAAATAAAEATAAGVTTTGLGAIPEAITTAVPEAVTTAVPEVTAAVPEVTTAVPEVADASQGILQANNAAIDTSMGPTNMGTGVQGGGNILAEGEAIPDPITGTNGFDPTAAAPDAAQNGIGSYFDKGWQSASDMFSKVGDKLDSGANWIEAHPKTSLGLGLMGAKAVDAMTKQKIPGPKKYDGPLSKYHLASNYQPAVATPQYYSPQYAAQGGIMSLAMGGPATTPQPGQMFPQSQQPQTRFATATQMPTSAEVINAGYEPATDPYTGAQPLRMSDGGKTTNPLLALYKQTINPNFKEAPTADTGIHEDIDADTRLQDPLTAANTRARKLDFMTKAMPFKPQQINPQLAQAQQQAVQAAKGGIIGYASGGMGTYNNQNMADALSAMGPLGSLFGGMFEDANTTTQSQAGSLSRDFQGTDPVVATRYTPSYDNYAGSSNNNSNYDINVDDQGNETYAAGGIMGYSLGGYAAGGRQPRLLKGPGDGMSDNIPATIADRQPARLADGEFVVPADVVSHLGNGSTDAGAKHLHTMMDKVRVARTGKKKQGTQIKPEKYLPA